MSSWTLDVDVLVLGGGSAGAMAAIWAKEMDPSQRVAIFEKGDIKYSGSIPRGMDALNVVAVPGLSTSEEYMQSIRLTSEGVVDDSPSYAMVGRSWDLVQTLASWGVHFPHDDRGNYEVVQTHPRGRFTLTMHDPELKVKLAQQVRARGCQVFNRVMAVELLVEEGRVVGAIGLNVRSGELVVARAKSVILASGGAARFGLPSSGYLYGGFDFPGNSGDGYMLAYRAGAHLTGFEHTMRNCLVKDMGAPLMYIVLTRGARVFDALDGELTRAESRLDTMLRRHDQGRGPNRLVLRDLSEERIRQIEEILFTVERPAQKRFFEGRGIDFRRSDIELWPTDYFLCGGHGMTGVLVNERAETTVPGLFAAGDNACVARGYLSGAFIFGQIAAESATAYARSAQRARLNDGQVQVVEHKLANIAAAKGRVGVDEFEFKARRMITDYATPPKNAYKLKQALVMAERLLRDLPVVVAVRDVRDVTKVLEIESIIGCLALSAAASLERKESRWGSFHLRTDYPERDDANWLKHVVCRRGESDLDVRVSSQPVQRLGVAE